MKTIEKILQTTYDMFADLGYDKTSMSRIADAVGISKPALYHYFKSKNALFDCLLEVMIDEIHEQKSFDGQNQKDLQDYFIDLGHTEIDYQNDNPKFMSVIKQYQLLAIRLESIHILLKNFENKLRDRYRNPLLKAASQKIIKQSEIELICEFLYLMDNGISEEMIYHKKDYKKTWTEFIKRII